MDADCSVLFILLIADGDERQLCLALLLYPAVISTGCSRQAVLPTLAGCRLALSTVK